MHGIFTRRVFTSGGAGSYLLSRRFSGFYDRPSEEISQSFKNHSEHAQNGNVTRERAGIATCFAAISVQDFDSIIFLFALSNF